MTSWPRRLLSKLGQAAGTALAVLIVAFLLIRLVPGDPVTGLLGARATPEAAVALRAELNLDAPLHEQFLTYLLGVLRGDFGNSVFQQGRSVIDIVGAALPSTVTVILVTVVISVCIGVPLGIWAAVATRRAVDRIVQTIAIVMLATPVFFSGLVLLLIFSLNLDLFPAGGWSRTWPDALWFAILPALALSGYLLPLVIRVVRQAAKTVVGERFMEAAEVRGLSTGTLTWRHVLPNSVLPVVTLVGINLGALLTGAVVVEAVFGLPGMGTEMVNAVAVRDYPVIQGVAIMCALTVVVVTVIFDALYLLLDPTARR